MRSRFTSYMFLTTLLATTTTVAIAEEIRYVSDELEIVMRKGESVKHRIGAMLKSGTELEILGVNKKSGYSKVKTPKGSVGFVLTRQLMDEPSVREKLVAANERIQELQTEPEKIRSRLVQLQEDYKDLQEQYKSTAAGKATLEQQLAGIKQTASNAMNIAEERSQLRKQVSALTKQNGDLKQQTLDLQNNESQRWFMIGAGVVFGSLFLGWLLPRLKFGRRRRSSWQDI